MGAVDISVTTSIIISLSVGIPVILLLIGIILSIVRLVRLTKETGTTKYVRKLFWMIFVNLMCSFMTCGACHVYDRRHLASQDEIDHEIRIKKYKEEELMKLKEKKKDYQKDDLKGYDFPEPDVIPEKPSSDDFIITPESIEKIQTLIGTKEEISIKWLSTVSVIPEIKVEDIVTLHLGLTVSNGKVLNKKNKLR
ncbi:MAG: hypothetical protein FK733_17815 [Asgard group archaeon]|nr:hypothetical protein [Asgard group archaeon]